MGIRLLARRAGGGGTLPTGARGGPALRWHSRTVSLSAAQSPSGWRGSLRPSASARELLQGTRPVPALLSGKSPFGVWKACRGHGRAEDASPTSGCVKAGQRVPEGAATVSLTRWPRPGTVVLLLLLLLLCDFPAVTVRTPPDWGPSQRCHTPCSSVAGRWDFREGH